MSLTLTIKLRLLPILKTSSKTLNMCLCSKPAVPQSEPTLSQTRKSLRRSRVLSLTEVALSGLAGQQDLNTGDHQIAWDLVPCGSATFLLPQSWSSKLFYFKD